MRQGVCCFLVTTMAAFAQFVEPPAKQIEEPKFYLGSSYLINWTQSTTGQPLSIYLAIPSTTSKVSTIATGLLPNTTLFKWDIPSSLMAASGYKLILSDGSSSSESTPFTLYSESNAAPNPPPPPPASTVPTLNPAQIAGIVIGAVFFVMLNILLFKRIMKPRNRRFEHFAPPKTSSYRRTSLADSCPDSSSLFDDEWISRSQKSFSLEKHKSASIFDDPRLFKSVTMDRASDSAPKPNLHYYSRPF